MLAWYELLRVLPAYAGRVVTFDARQREVRAGRGQGDSELAHAFVVKLRRKLGDDSHRPALERVVRSWSRSLRVCTTGVRSRSARITV